MPIFRVDREGRLLDILKAALPGWKAGTLKNRLKGGLVLVDGKPVHTGAGLIAAGRTIEVVSAPPRVSGHFPARLGEPPLPVLYVDDALIAVDKPAGLLCVATEREKHLTAIRIMREWLAELDAGAGRTLHAAHRLDRDASGVFLMARSLDVKQRLARAWRTFEKVYLAVVDGTPPAPEGSIDIPLREDKALFVRPAERGGGEEALTHYRLLETRGGRSLLEVRLGTGRKHQIRVHLAKIGCPIVGDLRYGESKAPRLALHAKRLRLAHPDDGRPVDIQSGTPAVFRKLLAMGGKR